MPAEVALSNERFLHDALDDFPVRSEGHHVDAERLESSFCVLEEVVSEESVVELDHKRANAIFFHQIMESESAVFPAGEGDYAVILILPTVFFNQEIELLFASFPVDFPVAELFLSADVANLLNIQ